MQQMQVFCYLVSFNTQLYQLNAQICHSTTIFTQMYSVLLRLHSFMKEIVQKFCTNSLRSEDLTKNKINFRIIVKPCPCLRT